MNAVRLTRATERAVLRCGACNRRVGAVHVTRWGPALVALEYPSREEREEHGERIPPTENLHPLPGFTLALPAGPLAAACPNHGDVDVDLRRILAAVAGGYRSVPLERAASPRPATRTS